MSRSNNDKKLLLKTWLLMGYIRLILWIFPFQQTQTIVEKMATKNKIKAKSSMEKLIWAVRVTSPFIPGSTCLTNALTGYVLLSREDYPNNLRIGVTKGDEGNFEAHAWLESGDKTVLGESEIEYQTIL